MRRALTVAAWTVRSGLGRPWAWVVAAGGCLALWAGVSLEILALGAGSRALALGAGTAEACALLAVVVLLPRHLAEDDASGLGAALDGGGAGYVNRLTGRFLGGAGLAALVALPVALTSVALYKDSPWLWAGWSVALAGEILAAAGWTALLARMLPAAGATLLAVLLLLAARAGPGSGLAALLPRPLDVDATAASAASFAAQALVAAATVLAACARSPAPRTV